MSPSQSAKPITWPQQDPSASLGLSPYRTPGSPKKKSLLANAITSLKSFFIGGDFNASPGGALKVKIS